MKFCVGWKTKGKKRMPDRTQYRKGKAALIQVVPVLDWNEFNAYHVIFAYRNGQLPY